jgi:DNA-binding CsgD family transcriptional regulator
MEALRESYPPLFRRHARRPRLTRLLDESTAQTILVTAPAGYGKTTLAAEWVQGRDDVIWYRATSGSADVAAFSAGLVDVMAPIVPKAGNRLKQRLRVADTPERAARPLAEILSEDLASWPASALLIIDDYHLVTDSEPVEEFMDWLLMLTPQLHVLVTTRRRPSWASARRILYGEITEIDRGQLAMTTDEAALVLEGRPTEQVRALVQQAEGWPALIGLAALSATHEIPTERVSDALYRYFAEEVVRGEAPEVERFMLMASVPPEVDPRLMGELMGEDTASKILSHLTEEALVERRGGRVSFHPLLRTFLRQSLRELDPQLFQNVSTRSLAAAVSQERWEQGFDIAIESGELDTAADILDKATPGLLAAGQTELLERWLNECGTLGIDHPAAVLARVELLIREGRLSEALPLARDLGQRLPRPSTHASRALYLAGFAAHLLSQQRMALDLHLQARELAPGPREESNALWGAHIAALELQDAEATAYLGALEALELTDAATRLRVATGRIGIATAAANVSGVLAMVDPLIALVDHANEPMVSTSFLSRVAELEIVRTRYDHGLALAARALRIAADLHLDFAVGYCLVQRVNAEVGLRRFEAARRSLKKLSEISLAREDPYLEIARQMMHTKIRLANRRHRFTEEDLPEHIWETAPVSVRAEYLGLTALAAIVRNDPDEASALATEARELSEAADSRFTSRFGSTIAQHMNTGDETVFRRSVIELTVECGDAEVLDPLVQVARAFPRVAAAASVDPTARRIYRDSLLRSKDGSIARSANLITEELDGVITRGLDSVLTPREIEVLELVSLGLSNLAIARRLVITESTTKVHVHHILRKLGVTTRLQAALRFGQYDAGPS